MRTGPWVGTKAHDSTAPHLDSYFSRRRRAGGIAYRREIQLERTAVLAGRAQLSKALARDELRHPGIHVLTGPADEGAPRLYVGETDVLFDRWNKSHQ